MNPLAANTLYADGFQLLHAVYAVESFLQKLKERGCNFHVVWFKDYRELCSPGNIDDDLTTKFILTRAIVIRHLQKLHLGVPGSDSSAQSDQFSLEFTNLQDGQFQEYLENNALHFFLCLGGKASEICSDEIGDAHLSVAHALGLHGHSLAFINHIEFVSSKVRGHKSRSTILLYFFPPLTSCTNLTR